MKTFTQSIGLLLLLLLSTSPTTFAQNWENPGFTPFYAIAYDQNGADRTVVTLSNVYRSNDNGATWDQKLSRDNAPFLTNAALETPFFSGGTDAFHGFDPDGTYVFDDVVFLKAELGFGFSSSAYDLYASNDGGETLTLVFSEDEAFVGQVQYGYAHDIWRAEATSDSYVIRFNSNGIAANGGDRSSIYVSHDEGQSWSFLFSHPENNIDFVGTAGEDYVFLHEDQLLYHNRFSGALTQTITLPETMRAGFVIGNSLRLLAFDLGGQELRGYRTLSGPNGPFTETAVNIGADIDAAQILGDDIFVSAGGFSSSDKSYRTSFTNFNSVVNVSEPGSYRSYYPYRRTSDNALVNALPGPEPHFSIFAYNFDQNIFDSPFLVSDDNWNTTYKPEYPPYALTALPLLDGKYLRLVGDEAQSTTNGVDYTKEFGLINFPGRIKYLDGLVYAEAYSDPSTTYYRTNDAETVMTGIPNIIGANGTYYAYRPTTIPRGVYRSTDGGESFQFLNDGYIPHPRYTVVDSETDIWYSFELGFQGGDEYTFRVQRSTDEGQSWALVTGTDFPQLTFDDLFYNQFYPFFVWNGNFIFKDEGELKVSTDGGATFTSIPNLPFELDGAQMFRLGDYLGIETAAEEYFRVDLNDWLGAQPAPQLPGGNIDLELEVTLSPANPAPFQNFDVIYTLTNNGNIPATGTGLATFIASSGNAIQQGGTTVDYVNFTPGFNNSLPAGETATITYHYFRLDGDPVRPWGQLTGYREPDVDSRPGNGEFPAVAEDDEARYLSSPSDPCVADTEAPVLTNCPDDIVVGTDQDEIFVGWTPPTFTDNCEADLFTTVTPYVSSFNPGRFFPANSVTTITYAAEDVFGNWVECSFTVTINEDGGNPCDNDTEAPFFFSCPPDFTVTLDPGETSTTVNLYAGASDNCTTNVPLTLDGVPANGEYFPGVYPIVYTATDESGNTAQCAFNVTVIGDNDPCDNDTTPPVFTTCQTDLVIVLDPGQTSTTSGPLEVEVADNCTQNVFLMLEGAGNGNFTEGVYPLVFTATDEAGNSAECAFTITVLAGDDPCDNDTEAPVFANCPNDVTVTAAPGAGTAVVNFTPPTFADNCAFSVTDNVPAGNEFPLGTTTVVFTAEDPSQNTAQCIFLVTVLADDGGGGGSDGVDLELSVSQPNATPAIYSSYSVIVEVENNGTDPATGVEVQIPKPDGVVYTGGNEFTASQGNYQLFGTEIWTVGALGAGESATLEISYFLLQATAPLVYAQVVAQNESDADSTPNNGTPPTPNEDDEANSVDGSGSGGGGGGPCNDDQTPPSLVCPDDISLTISGTTTTVDWEIPVTNDNCPGTIDLTSTRAPGSVFGLGGTAVAYTATDAAGNSAQCVFFVNITQDNGGNDQPDLTLSNIGLQNSPVAPGAVLNYEFSLENFGTAAASGDFNVRAYISVDAQLSADDVQDGIVPTGNYAAGFAQIVQGASTIPAGLNDGTYYLILAADADDDIAESDENNNLASVPFQIESGGGGGGGGGTGDVCEDIEVTVAPGQITISNVSTPHRILKVFDPSFNTLLDCVDGNCTDPQVVDNLPAGSYYVSVKLFDAQWQQLCNEESFYSVPSMQIQGFSVPALAGRPLQVRQIAPNPVYDGMTTATIFVKTAQVLPVEIYNERGERVAIHSVDFREGRNRVDIPTYDLTDGMYLLHVPGMDLRGMPVRFVVVQR